ncbi:MAG: FIG00456040: hypothetical protein [uncultured Paraburkholderia sp.]|nr:MAG: FIG00456040: hypothetical protein [uncultured Paraburkholderia sp.]CAH2777288.1 MAG: FIG00456040: hypothetical protein [uncultured Paraburkholderia sp.]CAH2912707.1 MAG: FIG00456040: hypothetical protein [uncultured Paraburkholderia sp.]CAH2925491.1 MAG: FIG00456040: hypothetical protein [uncultured Paraburkholderia sp.]
MHKPVVPRGRYSWKGPFSGVSPDLGGPEKPGWPALSCEGCEMSRQPKRLPAKDAIVTDASRTPKRSRPPAAAPSRQKGLSSISSMMDGWFANHILIRSACVKKSP